MSEENKDDGRRIPEEIREKAKALLSDWRVWLTESMDQVEKFTKEKPATGLSLSFLTGFLLASWLRRR